MDKNIQHSYPKQLDLFDGVNFPFFSYNEKIRLIEEKQENLRKGLFRRWDQQEKKIKALSESLNQVLNLLGKE